MFQPAFPERNALFSFAFQKKFIQNLCFQTLWLWPRDISRQESIISKFLPSFSLLLWAVQLWLQELTPSKLAGGCCICTGLLSLVAFQAPSWFMAWRGKHRKSRLSVSLKTTWKSRYQRATYLCWLRACFLIKDQETSGQKSQVWGEERNSAQLTCCHNKR